MSLDNFERCVVPICHANGIDINYRLEGDGDETIVLINGLADDLETWAYQMDDLLNAGYRVVRFDNRGVGASDKPAGPYTSALLAQDTKALVDALSLDRVHLVGVSMGGMVAQEYALAYPSDLKSLTLACTYAAPGPFCSRMFALWEDLARTEGLAVVMREVLLWAFSLDFFDHRESELREFEDALGSLPQPLDAYLAQLHAIQSHDTTARLSSISTPTLVLAGEDDRLIPVRLSQRLHEGLPDAVWASVPGAHACLWEHPEPFNRALLAFLTNHR